MNLNSTKSTLATILLCLSLAALTGCASVPMASKEQDSASKSFAPPPADKSALYVFRNSFVGKSLKKLVYIDGKQIGQTANQVYFYNEISPGSHIISTESEFGDNSVTFQAEGGKNYFARQYIKMGVFVGGAGIEMVPEEEGKKEVLQCERAQTFNSATGK
ncbi:MAG: DUF2846 domain-containing protein [Sulfuriferula sp.]